MDKYTNVYFDFKRSQFVKTLTFKHKNVKDKRIILFMKHLYLKKVVNAFQISIIVASTIITFFESMKPHIFQENRDKKTQIISICLSTYIAVITAVFKFLKIVRINDGSELSKYQSSHIPRDLGLAKVGVWLPSISF